MYRRILVPLDGTDVAERRIYRNGRRARDGDDVSARSITV